MTSSSGSGRPARLQPPLTNTANNVYGLLDGPLAVTELAGLLQAAGWSVRKPSWDEFECTVEWCSFELGQPGGQLKLAGVVDPDRVHELAATLIRLGVGCHLELYDGATHLVQTVQQEPSTE